MPTGSPIRVLELRSALGTGGGPEKTIFLGTERTDARRFEITICYLRDLRDRSFRVSDRAGERVRYVEVLERHSFDPDIWRQLRERVRDGRFDIVHAHDYKTDLFAYLLSWFEPVIPLATSHGWAGDSARERFYYWADRKLLTRYPCVVAVSSVIRGILLRAGAKPERVRLVPNAIDPESYRRNPAHEAEARRAFGLEPGTVAVGTVGRLESEKGLDHLLEAMGRIRDAFPRIRLLVAGSGSLLPKLREQTDRLGLGEHVRFIGHLTDVIGFHHALDFYVQSSIREGTPNAVLEAMALETPIVATDAGGTRDLVRDGEHAILVPIGDSDAIAAGLRRALTDPEGARRRARAARARVEGELSFAARMAAVEAIYEELMSTRRSSP